MRRPKILIVDDEINVLNSWERALRLSGFDVRVAQTCKNALNECDKNAFDLVILDFLMPEMTGIELLTRIRRILPFVRSIVISGKIDQQEDEESISRKLQESIEADFYLHKPLSNVRLRECINSLFEKDGGETNWVNLAKFAKRGRKVKVKNAKNVAKDLKKLVRKKK